MVELRKLVYEWVAENHGRLMEQQVRYSLYTSGIGQLRKAKAVFRFEAPTAIVQVDLWDSGEADVMEVRQGNVTADHSSFEDRLSLLRVLDECSRRLTGVRYE